MSDSLDVPDSVPPARSSAWSASANPAPDPGRVAGHFAGVGDGDLLELAARDETVRRLLVDVASVVAEVEAEDLAVDADSLSTTAARRPLSPPVRARAIAAFAAAGASRVRESAAAPAFGRGCGTTTSDASFAVDAVERPGSARPSRRWGRAAIAAALLLVPAVGLAVSGRRVEAASLSLEGFDRVGVGGDVESGGPRRLAIGARVEARVGERVALRLTGGTRVVLADRAQMAVGCDAPCDGRCGGAVFEIESGAVVVAAAGGPEVSPVAVRVPSAGRVDVWAGAARVDRHAEGGYSLSLRSDARVRWSPDVGPARELVGPAVLRLGPTPGSPPSPATASVGTVPAPSSVGPAVPASSEDAAIDAAAFRDLEFFGGPLRRAGDEVRVGCRRWRVVDSGGRARRSEMGGAPAIRFDLDGDSIARAAWPADAPVYGARRLEVRFRAVASAHAPGADGPRRTVRVRLDGVPGAEGSVALDDAPATPAAVGEVPGLLRAILPLPASFRDAPSELSDLVLSWSVEGGASTVWFESVVFLEVGGAEGVAR